MIGGDAIGRSKLAARTTGLAGHRARAIDPIAREGAVLTHHRGKPSCTVGRASLFMGRSAFRTGLSRPGAPGTEIGMPTEGPTIPGLLEARGLAADDGPATDTGPDAAWNPSGREKNTSREGGRRVPAMVRWPARIEPGSLSDQIVHPMDPLPTFLAAAGAATMEDDRREGAVGTIGREHEVHRDRCDFVPCPSVAGTEPPREEVLCCSHDGGLPALRYQDGKVLFIEPKVAGAPRVPQEPFTPLRPASILDLPRDLFERATITSITDDDRPPDRAVPIVAAQGAPRRRAASPSGASSRALSGQPSGVAVPVARAELAMVDAEAGRPVGIRRLIGRRPIAAFGKSDGDLAKLQWTPPRGARAQPRRARPPRRRRVRARLRPGSPGRSAGPGGGRGRPEVAGWWGLPVSAALCRLLLLHRPWPHPVCGLPLRDVLEPRPRPVATRPDDHGGLALIGGQGDAFAIFGEPLGRRKREKPLASGPAGTRREREPPGRNLAARRHGARRGAQRPPRAGRRPAVRAHRRRAGGRPARAGRDQRHRDPGHGPPRSGGRGGDRTERRRRARDAGARAGARRARGPSAPASSAATAASWPGPRTSPGRRGGRRAGPRGAPGRPAASARPAALDRIGHPDWYQEARCASRPASIASQGLDAAQRQRSGRPT